MLHVCGARLALPLDEPEFVGRTLERGIPLALYQLRVRATARLGRESDLVAQLVRVPGVLTASTADDGALVVVYRAVSP